MVAAEAEPASSILGGDGGERRAELGFERVEAARFLGAQPGLELGPARLDRIEVRG